jgi:hypothetical protein
MPSAADEPSVANPRTPSPIRPLCRLLCRSPIAPPVFPAAAVALRRRVVPRARNAGASRTAWPRRGPRVPGLAHMRAHSSLCLGPRPPPCRRRAATLGGQGVARSPTRTTLHGPCLPLLLAAPPLAMPSPSPSSRRSHGDRTRRCEVAARRTRVPLRHIAEHPACVCTHTPTVPTHTCPHPRMPHWIQTLLHRIPPRPTRGTAQSAGREKKEGRPPAHRGPRSNKAQDEPPASTRSPRQPDR